MTKYKHLLNSDLYNLKHRKIFSLHFAEPLSDLINASNARLANALELSHEFKQKISLLHSSKERKPHGYI